MLLLAVSLFAISTLAQSETNGTVSSYVECYVNSDCTNYREYSDKPYCYNGMCTNMCPPGYVQQNYGSEPTFVCNCDTAKGFKVAGYFPNITNSTDARVPKCRCDQSYCQVLIYATGVGYVNGLIPNGRPPNCKSIPDEIPLVVTEFIFYFLIGTMIIFTVINFRSTSSVIYDFHRYIGIYVVASIAVIVFVQTVQPFTAGFTRSMGFGVIIHNSAEWNFLLRLQYGKQVTVRNSQNMCVMFYYVVLLIAMAVLPLELLFYIAMIQGGFLDWSLLFFLIVGGKRMYVKNEDNWQPILNNCCKTTFSRFVVWYGLAAFFHLATVEILFVGFALNMPALIGLGSLLLVPTFFCYTYWAYGEDRSTLLCGPSVVMEYEEKKLLPTGNSMTLVPYAHTTRLSDIVWQGLVKNRWTTSDSNAGASDNAGDGNETEKLVEPVTDRIVIQDYENFKFGAKLTKKCPIGPSWLSWIPLYWVAALHIVIINAGIILSVPSLIQQPGECISGYEYGAW